MAKYSYEQKPGESIEQYYRRIAKVADQRLVRLEKLATQEGFGNAKQWAYRRAMSDIETWSGEGATRFNTKPPEDMQALRAKINDIKTFLGKPSSTKSGIKAVYQKRIDTLNKNHNTNFTINDIIKLFGDGNLDEVLDKLGGSDTTIEAIGYLKDNAKDRKILKQLEADAKVSSDVPEYTGDPFLDERINKVLKDPEITKIMYKYIRSMKK